MMTVPTLEVDELRVWAPTPAGPALVVDGVSLVVRPGSVHGVAGESGSGKSLTAQALIGLLPEGMVREGAISLQGRRVEQVSSREQRRIRGSQIAMVFQDPQTSLHPMLTIGKQLTEHLRKSSGASKQEAMQRATELLEDVRIPNPSWALAAYPHQFSGGMRQRIAIAMALMCDPKLLIADEITTALDVTVQAGILRLLARLCREKDLSVIYITHDLGVMLALADDLTILYAGRVVESGSTKDVLTSPRHPYTFQLLRALPQGTRKDRLTPIPGDAATPTNRPPGCAFHPRCLYAEPSCSRDVPELLPIDAARLSACPVDPLPGNRP